MHKKLTYVDKCHHEKLKQKIIKCLICFSNTKIIQPSLHFLHHSFLDGFCQNLSQKHFGWKGDIKSLRSFSAVFPLQFLHIDQTHDILCLCSTEISQQNTLFSM